jgi:riboflavin kinase/FMN adenylyltransferase
MEILWNINDIVLDRETVLTMGTFDGVHVGHQLLIDTVLKQANASGFKSVVITFEPHPQLVLNRGEETTLRLLTTVEEKIQRLSAAALDVLVIVPFLPSFAVMEPQEFVQQVLIEKCRMAEIVIGHDHAFGKARSGNRELLLKLSAQKGFRVTALEPVVMDGETVSSTRIRAALQAGRVEQVVPWLGRPYSLQGRVIHGDGRGRDLGFPTVNLRPFSPFKLMPLNGIYLSKLRFNEQAYPAVTYIGTRPTFAQHERVVETFVIDFKQDLYDREVGIDFLKYMRADMKFERTDDLIQQIRLDVIKSLELFKTIES